MIEVRKSGFLQAIPLLITIFSLSVPAYAKYGGGSGEPNDPYQIATAEDLMLLGESTEDYDKHFIMIDDIDLDPNLPGRRVFDRAVIAPDTNDVEDWFQGTSFTGVFDGNGHVISHLTITGVGYLGLFGQLGDEAEVKSLGLVAINIIGSGNFVGGLVGLNWTGYVTNCYYNGAISGYMYVGGLVGENDRGNIETSYSSGAVSGIEYVGGLVGYNWFISTVSNSYNSGTVEGHNIVGGLVGYNSGSYIRNCYSVGSVVGNDNVGGLVGGKDSPFYGFWQIQSKIINCFWDLETSFQTTSAGGIGKTTAEMQMSVTFNDWVYCFGKSKGVWTIDEGNDYPRLWWENAQGLLIELIHPCIEHASNPNPPDGVLYEVTWVNLNWLPGVCAASHRLYFGEDFNDVYNGTGGTFKGNQTTTSYIVGIPGFAYPDGLVSGTIYYWRVDEVNNIHPESPWKGDVWSFRLLSKIAFNPNPPEGSLYRDIQVNLSWEPGDFAVSHEVYFGEDEEAVANATTVSPDIYRGQLPIEVTTYDPGILEWNRTYFWRIDEVNETDPNSPWKGNTWSFTTANFIVVDDFESYSDISEGLNRNRIYHIWTDGWVDPNNGSQTGHLDVPFYEETIVHGGNKSMPLYYDNSGPANYSEATASIGYLEIDRDWTREGVSILSLWFHGDPNNSPELMYVALANRDGPSAIVYHDDPNATTIKTWTEWTIDLQAFTDQGLNLKDVHKISIGFGDRNDSQPGGTGYVYFDDIRLYRPDADPRL